MLVLDGGGGGQDNVAHSNGREADGLDGPQPGVRPVGPSSEDGGAVRDRNHLALLLLGGVVLLLDMGRQVVFPTQEQNIRITTE